VPVLDNLSVNELGALAVSVSVTGYGNTIASIIAATFSVRGFAAAGSVPNRLTNTLFSVAIGTVLHSVYLLVKGVY